MNTTACECTDPDCPACRGACGRKAREILYRVDIEDRTGTMFCTGCAADAYESGLFTDEAP